jgi:hypothetical protein
VSLSRRMRSFRNRESRPHERHSFTN